MDDVRQEIWDKAVEAGEDPRVALSQAFGRAFLYPWSWPVRDEEEETRE